MTTIGRTSNTRIAIHQGHYEVDPTPDWIGTVDEYWEANQETLVWNDIHEMMLDLAEGRDHRIGGGAQGCFTVRRA